jgi:hypothetical protein
MIRFHVVAAGIAPIDAVEHELLMAVTENGNADWALVQR